jgi:hypothetical protein
MQLSMVSEGHGCPVGVFRVPRPAPAEILSHDNGHGIPTQMGTGSNGTHGYYNPCGIGLWVCTKGP